MFIQGNKEEGFQIHLNSQDTEDFQAIGDLLRITLSAEKAKELEDRLEEIIREH